jgi:hypothetical protein
MSGASWVGRGLRPRTAARLTEAAVVKLTVKALTSSAPPIFPGPESAYIASQTIPEPLIVRFLCA